MATDRQARIALRKELTRAEEEYERLGVVIAYLRARLREGEYEAGIAPGGPNGIGPATEPRRGGRHGGGPYVGMTSTNASAELLESVGHAMRTPEIYDAITAGGAKIKDVEGLYKTLARNKRFVREGRGAWGLAQWRHHSDPSASASDLREPPVQGMGEA